MSYDWNNYGKFAKWLESIEISEIDEETKIRNIISRMNYHAFHCLLNWVESKSSYKFPTNGTTHKELINHLIQTRKYDKAQSYKKLKQYRELCDYEDNISSLKVIYEEAKLLYNRIVGPLVQFSQKTDS